MREWVELFDEPGLVHRELEVHTVYQRFFVQAGKDLHPRTFQVILHTYTRCVAKVSE